MHVPHDYLGGLDPTDKSLSSPLFKLENSLFLVGGGGGVFSGKSQA